ncbi:MAG: 5'-nucleotidase C-terminal domain-containing protein [Candidatus Eisenbacteria bacterium]|nr:5'-nucleotidase C-terminal domain-containing protein [Candidatus Eisenbacteria bacterium]
MRRSLAVLALALFAFALPAAAEEARITVLHTTDVHGSLLPWDDLLDKPAARGLARAATRIAKVRAEGRPVLLLDAGDAMAGSPLVSVWHREPAGMPEPVSAAMNALGYDAMALGNHEFDHGPAGIDSARASSRFPWLAANVVRSDGSPAFPPSLVREYDGVRVGVIGLCTPAVPLMADSAQWAGYVFLSPIEVARKEVARLRGAERCDVVIALAHTGLEKDPRTGEARRGDAPGENFGHQLASEVRGIDVVILAHTHQMLPYADISGTVVTQAGKAAEGMGRIDLTLVRDTPASPWKLTQRRTSLVTFGDSTATDEAFAAQFAPYAARTKAALDEVVAQADGELAMAGGRFADGPLWQMVHRAQLEASGADVSLAALFDPAQRVPAGPIRVRDLMRLYPYDNTLVTVEMTGAELEAALEHSARYLATYTYDDGRPLAEPGMPGWNFDMAMGVQYEIDLTRPAGDRVRHLTFAGAPLAPEKRLRVVVNSYRAAGGGDFTMIRRAPRVWRGGTAPDALLASVRKAQHVSAKFEPSWTVLPDYAPTPERPLIDRLVRLGVAPPSEVRHLIPHEPARRVDLAYWLGRAFGWRSGRPSGAFADVPDSLEPWLDGILSKGVLGRDGQGERFDPFRPARVVTALDWAERCARSAEYSLATPRTGAGDLAFWRGLLTGVSLAGAPGRGGIAFDATLTRAQWLGMVSNLRYPQVRVLETTDFHGAILGGTRDRRSGRPVGGTPALAAIIEKYRGENPEGTVLIDGGDIFQGTMISNLQYGRPVVEQMNLLDYAAAAIGNHEFDWTADTLKNRVMAMKFPALGANMLERRTNKRPWWVRSDTTVTRRGVRVGIFGLAYPGTPRVTMPAYVAHLRFADDSATAAPIPARLRKAGAGLVVAVGHIPAETDSSRKARGDIARLANGIRGVDGWFGGHSHNVVDDRIQGAPVMVAGANGQWLALADYTVDPVGRKVVESRSRMLQVFADELEADTAWVARVERWNAEVGPVAATVLGKSSVPLDRNRPEATIGDFITDAMRFATGADIAMQNPGGMRANMAAGPVTRGMVYDVMPFDNTMVTMELTGAEVRRALEQALRGDRITQVSGIRYVLDMNAPAMSRVISITNTDGSSFDEARLYKVVVNNFMASGGDSYDALAGGRNKIDSGQVIRGAMEDWVRERCKGGAVLEIKPDGRIQHAPR